MNAKDLIQLTEYLQAFKQPKQKRWKQPKDLDILTLLRKEQEKAEMLSKFLKDHEKLNKKEEKKAEHKLTFAEGMILAYIASFVVGPLYKVFLVHLGVQ